MTAVIARASGSDSAIEGWSIGSAYAAFTLMVVSLSLGPLNIMRRRHNPTHNVLRRDFGIAAGIAALLHTALGLQVHMKGDIVRYFALPDPALVSAKVFVAANYLGLLAAFILAILVVISNNISIRSLGLDRWKRMQRMVYLAAVATVLHGVLYQILETRAIPAVVLLLLVSLAVLVLQLRGAGKRRRHSG